MNVLAALNHWIHLMSAVMWVGALAFVVMTLIPALREKWPKESVENLSKAIQARYYRITGVLVALVLLTGGLNVRFVRTDSVVSKGLGSQWMVLFGVKMALVVGIISIYLLSLLYKGEPLSENKNSIPWARPSFILGVLIVLTAAFLRHSH